MVNEKKEKKQKKNSCAVLWVKDNDQGILQLMHDVTCSE